LLSASLQFASDAVTFSCAGPVTSSLRRMLQVHVAPAIRTYRSLCKFSYLPAPPMANFRLAPDVILGLPGLPNLRLTPDVLRPGQACLLFPVLTFRSTFAWTGGQPSTFAKNKSPTRQRHTSDLRQMRYASASPAAQLPTCIGCCILQLSWRPAPGFQPVIA